MLARLLLLLCLTGLVFAKELPGNYSVGLNPIVSLTDVDCLVVHLQYIHCSWNKQGTPAINYTFYSMSKNDKDFLECTSYLSENNINTGCDQSYNSSLKTFHFKTFYTKLVNGSNIQFKEHQLSKRVKLNPPTNLTVENGSDSNLWFYWNQTYSGCVESEVRFKKNNNQWEVSKVSIKTQSHCINLPSSNSRYELQVRSKIDYICGGSIFWSDWSEPVVWASNSSTDTSQMNVSMSAWTPVLYVMGTITLILLVMMLLHYERIRIILIPAVPKPSLARDTEDWFQLSKGLKERLRADYNERACPVREYCNVPQSDSESSDNSIFSFTTDQTDCSVSIHVDESDLSTPCSSSTAAVLVSPEEPEQVSV